MEPVADFCVCDYRPRRFCSEHPERFSVNRRSFLWYPVAMICATAAVAKDYRTDQIAVMRWDSSCIHLTEKSYAEAPMENGEPVYSKTRLHGVKLDAACGKPGVEKVK